MRMMMRLLITAVAPLLAAGSALAADLPQPPPPQAPATYLPVAAPVYNWGGIYFGVNGGYGFGTSKWTDPNNPSGLTNTRDFDVSGGLVGATAGANYQTDAFVFGVEGDFDASWIHGTTSSAFCGSVGLAAVSCETKNTWLSTIRARAGYAFDRVLVYGTGGIAFGNIEAGIGGNFDNTAKVGWTAGAGVEVALADNWTARLEYLYIDLQNGSCISTGDCGVDAPLTTVSDSVAFSTSLVRLGLNFKFR